jgi:hypothetical protein
MQFCHSHLPQMRETRTTRPARKPQTVVSDNKLPSPASSETVQPNRPNCSRKSFNQLSLAPAAVGPMASRRGLRRQLALDFPHFPLAWLSPSHSLEQLSDVPRGRLLGYHQMRLRHTGVLAGACRRVQFGGDCTSTPIAMIRLMRERATAIYRRNYMSAHYSGTSSVSANVTGFADTARSSGTGVSSGTVTAT